MTRKGIRLFWQLGVASWLLSGTGALFADFGEQQPKLIRRDDPKWPFKMDFGDDGMALILVDVSPRGTAESVRVLQTSKPDMEAATVEAALTWGFSPGLRRGEPVSMPVEIPVRVNVYHDTPGVIGVRAAGPKPWGVPPRADPNASLEFQYDQAPMPYLTLPAVYPRNLLVEGIKGSAAIAFAIDPYGRPSKFVVAEATRPEFGAATVAMMGTWRFTPPRDQGTPCWAAVRMTQKFNLNDEDIGTDDSTERVVAALKADPCPIVGDTRQLDRPPRIRYRPPPGVPDDVVRAGMTARAIIEIVIDRNGHAQLPRIVSATREDFGWAAATAAGRWQFTAPVKGGEPVDVFAKIPFEYRPPVARAAGTGVNLEVGSPKWRGYHIYLQLLTRSVGSEWRRILNESRSIHATGGTVTVKFTVNSRGGLSRVVSVNPSADESDEAIQACVSAIKNCSPYGAWTDDMAAALGKSQELTFTFTYE
jgi:TonB family protein